MIVPVVVEDDEERRAVVFVRVDNPDDARRRVEYLLEPTLARVVGFIGMDSSVAQEI